MTAPGTCGRCGHELADHAPDCPTTALERLRQVAERAAATATQPVPPADAKPAPRHWADDGDGA